MTTAEVDNLKLGDIIEVVTGRLDRCYYDTILGIRESDVGIQLMYSHQDSEQLYTHLIYNSTVIPNSGYDKHSIRAGRNDGYYVIRHCDCKDFKLA